MESEEPFGDEMPNFDICRTVFKELFKDIDVLDVYAKTETAASSENSGRKSTENEQNKRKRSIIILEDDEIEEFQSKQVAKNTVKGTESAATSFPGSLMMRDPGNEVESAVRNLFGKFGNLFAYVSNPI